MTTTLQDCVYLDGGAHGMFSLDCGVNEFCEYSHVYVRYCDGASYSGEVEAPVQVPVSANATESIYFRGARLLRESVDAALALGMSAAEVCLPLPLVGLFPLV